MMIYNRMILLLSALFLVVVLAGSAMAFGLGTDKFVQELEKEKTVVKMSREMARGGYGIISTEELKTAIDRGDDLLLIDTMPYEASYQKAHIPGAVSFLFPIPEMTAWDSSETDGQSLEAFKQLLGADRDRKIVVYCGFVKCTRSHNGAMWAVKLGYTNVVRHPGGIFAWKGAKYPVSSADEHNDL